MASETSDPATAFPTVDYTRDIRTKYVHILASCATVAPFRESRKDNLALRDWISLATKVFTVSVVGSPSAALVWLIWDRDVRVIGNDNLFSQ